MRTTHAPEVTYQENTEDEMNENLAVALAGKLSYESRDVGRVWNLLRGPYYQHNQLVRHAQKLKLENTESGPRYFRLLPLGGGYSIATDAAVFVIWLLVFVYPFAAIGTACFCRNVVNIISAVILAMLITFHIGCMWLASKNWKKLKHSWYFTKIAMPNLFGMENRLTNITTETLNQTDHLNKSQKQIILTKLHSEKMENGKVLVMIVSDVYWKTKVLDPIILLSVMATANLVSLILQIEFYKSDGVA
ncbi:uncharacterized protein LOC135476830 [Liolophura sinensis]|uniref:uncharacterized protein LOC135476830 n=1 Tax=Liolophura sinensis TaxID=3198878 RepID=UPI003159177C